jgi:hypothetical protein
VAIITVLIGHVSRLRHRSPSLNRAMNLPERREGARSPRAATLAAGDRGPSLRSG